VDVCPPQNLQKSINQSISQSNFLTWLKQQTVTSRTTKRTQFTFCTAKTWDRYMMIWWWWF